MLVPDYFREYESLSYRGEHTLEKRHPIWRGGPSTGLGLFAQKKKQFAFEKCCYHKLVLVFVFTEGLAKMPCSHRRLKDIVRFLVIFKDNWLVNLLVKKRTFLVLSISCQSYGANLITSNCSGEEIGPEKNR